MTIGSKVPLGASRRERRNVSCAACGAAEGASRALIHADSQLLAQDFHDALAHAITAMVLQAEAAAALLAVDPQRAAEAVRAVGATGRRSLEEMTRQPLVMADRPAAEADACLQCVRDLVAGFLPPPTGPATKGAITTLTPREMEVLQLIAKGHSNTDIASSLVLTTATVKSHINRLFSKLGITSRAQAVVLAYDHGLVHAAAHA